MFQGLELLALHTAGNESVAFMHECYAYTGTLERQTSGVAHKVAVADRNNTKFNTPTQAVTADPHHHKKTCMHMQLQRC